MKHKGIFWGVMGVFIIIGGVLVVLGMTMGGQLGNIRDVVHPDSKTVHVRDTSGSGNEDIMESSQNICNLDFDLAAGDVTIKMGDEFSVSGSKIHSEISDDGKTWYLESPKRKWHHFLSDWDGGDWEITLPKAHLFEEVTISFAAADLDVESLWTNKLTLHGGAGDADIQKLKVSDSMDLKIAAGSLSIDQGELAGDCRMDCGAGELDMGFSSLAGSLDANCGMGEINLDLPGERGNYKIDSKASMGNIQIDGEKQGGAPEALNIWADLSLTCGMGEIVVDFDGSHDHD